jgi:hypothetical protein
VREWINVPDGSIAALLVIEGFPDAPVFVRYDAGLANPELLAELEPQTFVGGGADPSRTQLYVQLHLRDGPTRVKFRYDDASRQLQPLGVSHSTIVADAAFAYFVRDRGIFRLPHGGTAPELLGESAPGNRLFDLWPTSDRVIAAGETGVVSVPKAGGEVTTLEPRLSSLFATAGQRVYYVTEEALPGGGTQPVAVQVAGDGTAASRHAGGRWVGQRNVAGGDLGGVDNGANVLTIVLGQQDPAGTLTLTSFDARTGLPLAMLGSIEQASIHEFERSFTYTPQMLFEIERNRGFQCGPGPEPTADTDVWFADLATPGSLEPVSEVECADDVVF